MIDNILADRLLLSDSRLEHWLWRYSENSGEGRGGAGFFFFFFCLLILACDLYRSWRRTFLPGFPVRSPREAARCKLP